MNLFKNLFKKKPSKDNKEVEIKKPQITYFIMKESDKKMIKYKTEEDK